MSVHQEQDLFKEEFKRYKKRSEAIDLADVMDFRNPGRFTEQVSHTMDIT